MGSFPFNGAASFLAGSLLTVVCVIWGMYWVCRSLVSIGVASLFMG